VLDGPVLQAEGYNPLCGDRITVYVRLDGGALAEVRFQGTGCAISQASASMMTQAVQGRSPSEVEALFRAFHQLVAGAETPPPDPAVLDKLVVFSGVREFPVRVKCATLAWHTLRAALERRPAVSTE
jgi:nitrogen fixation NifU-like protein